MEIIFVFSGTNDAIHAERLLVNNGFAVGVMNLPASIKAGCGICLRLKPQYAAAAQKCLEENSYPYHGIYRRELENGKSEYIFLQSMEDAE